MGQFQDTNAKVNLLHETGNMLPSSWVCSETRLQPLKGLECPGLSPGPATAGIGNVEDLLK